MVEIQSTYFNLEQIALSGQCFRMDMTGDNSCVCIAGDKYLRASQSGDRIFFECEDDEFKKFWKKYFDLEVDYGKYISAIDKNDKYLCAAAKKGSGIRILNQEIWETTVSFLISQQNKITRIKKCISNICRMYGEHKIASDGTEYFAFPKPEALACLSEDALMECGLGYRSKYVVRTARETADGSFELSELYKLPYQDARMRLMQLYGVGTKVADCICLFALHNIDAFPIDTHIKQVFAEHYPDGFPFERYNGFAGVLQQYMFYYDLHK